jgi:phage/plasmid primase-like uncharacterized protein
MQIVTQAAVVDQFRAAIAAAGLTAPETIEADGVLHRFSSNGERGDDAGYYILHTDGLPAGLFGCWRASIRQTWHAKSDRTFTPEERRAHRERIEAMRRAREAEREREHAASAARAVEIWDSAEPALEAHPYLTRKGVKAHGLRVHQGELVVPMRVAGKLCSLQFIAADGAKLFLRGGQTRGAYYAIGARTPTLCMAEGFATGASLHEATGHAVVVAFSASNLKPVAEGLRPKHPEVQIIICGDNDASGVGQRAAIEAARAVGGLVAIPKGEGMDWNDVAVAEGLDVVRAAIEAAQEPAAEPNAEADERHEVPTEVYDDDPEARAAGDGNERNSQASLLVGFVRARSRLIHDENGDVYAIENATNEVRNIERRSFRTWLHAEFYASTTKAARAQSVSEALTTLSGIGLHDGDLVDVHIRCAALGDGYVIDMCEPGKSRAIVVRPGGWTISEHHGVMFVRADNMKPLPEPIGGGTLDALWSLVNVQRDARLLVLTWLLECLRPDAPFPLLEAIGEQGSAKSGLQKLLKRLIDPSAIELRSAPKSGEDVFVGAGQGWLLCYDNVSHLSPDMQDVLCRVATGASFATRKLYTNAEESAIRAKRPVTLNGIGASITAQDLVDRAISLELPMIEDRREATAIESEFDRLHPALLGALLDLFAKALSILPRIAIDRDRRPRLIEFAKLGCAVAEAMGRRAEDFLTEFEEMRVESVARTIEASPVALALIEFLEDRPDREGERSAKQWYEGLTKPDGAEAWPRSPKGFSDALRRAAPALRSIGIYVSRPRKSHGSKVITITRKVAGTKSPTSPMSPQVTGPTDEGTDSGDVGDFGDFGPASISARTTEHEVEL